MPDGVDGYDGGALVSSKVLEVNGPAVADQLLSAHSACYKVHGLRPHHSYEARVSYVGVTPATVDLTFASYATDMNKHASLNHRIHEQQQNGDEKEYEEGIVMPLGASEPMFRHSRREEPSARQRKERKRMGPTDRRGSENPKQQQHVSRQQPDQERQWDDGERQRRSRISSSWQRRQLLDTSKIIFHTDAAGYPEYGGRDEDGARNADSVWGTSRLGSPLLCVTAHYASVRAPTAGNSDSDDAVHLAYQLVLEEALLGGVLPRSVCWVFPFVLVLLVFVEWVLAPRLLRFIATCR